MEDAGRRGRSGADAVCKVMWQMDGGGDDEMELANKVCGRKACDGCNCKHCLSVSLCILETKTLGSMRGPQCPLS